MLDPEMEELRAVNPMIAQAEADALEIGHALRQATGLVAKSLKQNMDGVNLRYEALFGRRKVLQSEVAETKLTDTAIECLVQFAQDVFVGIKEADFRTKRRNLEVLQIRVVVDSGKFTIESLAGKITGEIRKLPIVKKPGGGSVTNSRSPAPASRGYRFPAGPLLPAA
jgi:hypothetical protein